MKKLLNAQIFVCFVLLFEGLQFCFSNNSSFVCIEEERQALLKLKQSFEDPSNRLVSWTGEDCCQWRGVSCNRHTGHVLKLDLRAPIYSVFDAEYYNTSEQLSALQVNPCLGELNHLEYLDLSGNYFHRIRIPEFFGSFKYLKYLNLTHARFGGKIPHQLGNLTHLKVLDLSCWGLHSNTFKWASNLVSLQHLDMSFVNLNMAHDLIQVLNTLPSLLHLSLWNCEIQNIHFSHESTNNSTFKSVQSLNLGFNRLSGYVPRALANMTEIREIDLSKNNFNSIVPFWLVNSKNLVLLNFEWNQFDNIEGGLSSMLNNACHLKVLYMGENDFHNEIFGRKNKNSSNCLSYSLNYLDLSWCSLFGPMPFLIGELSQLRLFDLSNNELNGTIPLNLGKLSSLDYLDLSGNRLSGTIPLNLGKLSSLDYLDLSGNRLSGTIPLNLSKLSSLDYLDLSHNQFSGSIPQSIGMLPFLTYLDLSNNQLDGKIPESLGRLSTLEDLRISQNQLTGIPNSIGQMAGLQTLDVSSNPLTGIISEIHFANLSNLSFLILSSTNLTWKINSNWAPPFSLVEVNLSSGKIGSQFPQWLQTQNELQVIDLSYNNISGSLSQWINASSLWRVDLSHNNISGSLPQWINASSLFYVDLSHNNISGNLPQWINSSFLRYLDMTMNCLGGNSLSKILTVIPEVYTLRLGNNHIKGSIPTSLCNRTSLRAIDLSGNELTGEIPNCWKNSQGLAVINLSSNKLSGKLPSSLGQLSLLHRFHVSNNKMEGEIPLSLRNCTGLEFIDLGVNKFSGSVPTWIGENLSFLRIFRLRTNLLNGTIPPQICQLNELQILDLSENNLIGEIPHCFGNLSGMRKGEHVERSYFFNDTDREWKMENLGVNTKGLYLEFTKMQLKLLNLMDLSNNKLVGVIPEELCLLHGLHSLNLSHNHLSGNIPDTIGDLKLLDTLDLSNNKLFGTIPQSLSQLPSISHLNFSNNDLSGKIPTGNQLQTLTDPSIYAGNIQLCGDPLPKCPGDDEPAKPPITESSDEDEKDVILFWFIVVAGYAVGLWGVIATLIVKTNWRIAYFRFVEATKERLLVKAELLKQRMQRMISQQN